MNIDSETRGIVSETMVEQALLTIQNKSKKGLISRVISFIHAPRHSALDRQHIDFLVRLESGDEIPLQVKSSERGRRKFMRNYSSYKRYIPVIVVKIGEAIESVINKVTECIKLAFNKLRRKSNQITYLRRTTGQKRKRTYVRFHAPVAYH